MVRLTPLNKSDCDRVGTMCPVESPPLKVCWAKLGNVILNRRAVWLVLSHICKLFHLLEKCDVAWLLRHEFCHSAVLSHYDMNSVTTLYCHITTSILSLRCIFTWQHEICHSAVLSYYDMNSVTPLYYHITTWIISFQHIVTLQHEAMSPLYCHITPWILSLRYIVT